MSKKKVRIVEEAEVFSPLKTEGDYWMKCRKPTIITFNCILIVSIFIAKRPVKIGFKDTLKKIICSNYCCSNFMVYNGTLSHIFDS